VLEHIPADGQVEAILSERIALQIAQDLDVERHVPRQLFLGDVDPGDA
jgi:hypothetical protein